MEGTQAQPTVQHSDRPQQTDQPDQQSNGGRPAAASLLTSSDQQTGANTAAASQSAPSAQPPVADTLDGTAICPVCSQRFSNRRGLLSHLPSHSAESNRIRIDRLMPVNETSELNANEEAEPRESLVKQCQEWARRFQEMARNTGDLTKETKRSRAS